MGDSTTLVTGLHIALVHEQRATYLAAGQTEAHCAALPHEGEVQAVETALTALGHHVQLIPGIHALVQSLAANEHAHWDLAFNMAQGFYGDAREAQVPALLEAYRIPYTFADAATMALCQNKANAKTVLHYHGIPTSPFLVVSSTKLGGASINLPGLVSKASLPSYPLFLKPVTEGSSKGIDTTNKVCTEPDLEPAIRTLAAKCPNQDILVEPFLPGRELTVSILGTGSRSRVIGIREHVWQIKNKNGYTSRLDFASQRCKSSNSGDQMLAYDDRLDSSDPSVQAACRVSLDAWAVFGCRDAGRVDLRFDAEGVPNVLEVNPISGLLPGHSPLPASAEVNGVSYGDLLTGIIDSALERKAKA